MSSVFSDRDTSDDLFSDTRMSFGDHIEVLRKHLFRAILWFSIAREMTARVRQMVQGVQLSAPFGRYQMAIDVAEAIGSR